MSKPPYLKYHNNTIENCVYDSKTNQLLENNTYIYSYDGRGNRQSKIDKQTKEVISYKFNEFEQLVEVTTSNKEEETTHYLKYEYDAFNRRVSKEENSKKHYYLYHEQNIIAILDQDKDLLATIMHHPTQIDTPLSITNINGTFYYHRDHQGSIIALSDEDGNIVEEITYDGHYGKIVKHTTKVPTSPQKALHPPAYRCLLKKLGTTNHNLPKI